MRGSLTLLVRVTCPKYTSLRDSQDFDNIFLYTKLFYFVSVLLQSRLDILQTFLRTYISKLVTSACLYFLLSISLNYNEQSLTP